MAAKAEAGGCDDLELSVLERFRSVWGPQTRRAGARGPRSPAAPPPVAGRCRNARRRAAAWVPAGAPARPGRQLRVGPAGHPQRAHRGPTAAGGSLSLLASRTSAGAASPLPSMPTSSMTMRSGVCSASVMISRSGRRTRRPIARRVSSEAGVAIHRQQSEQRRQQQARGPACPVRLPALPPAPRSELRQLAPAQIRRFIATGPRPRDRVVDSRDARSSPASVSAASRSLPRRTRSRASEIVAAAFASRATAAR